MNKTVHHVKPRWIVLTENIIFNVKWLLPPFYLGLVIVMILYGVAYLREIVLLAPLAAKFSTEEMKIVVLDFVDLVMVANLVKMIIAGSYNSFVSKDHGRPNENISSGTLKIKISTSIIVVCSVHLLKNLITTQASWDEIKVKLLIFVSFLATTMVLGILEYLHIKGEAIETSTQRAEESVRSF